ncbi:MAG: M42 family peptidase, partial [Oscillospiraceae bacterium]
MLSLLEALCAERGISGDEARVRGRIIEALGGCCTLETDNLGNLIAVKPGKKPAKKIALFAHMDEVGVMITRITDEGLLKFEPIGIDPRVLHGRRMRVGDRGLPAVVGAKAWHHLDKAEREAPLRADGLYLDIGAADRREAEAVVSLGDAAVFDAPFVRFGDELLMSRALDDRAGCTLLIELLRSDFPFELTGVFTCGEEHSLFGATAAANAVAAELAVILETTTAGDAEGAPPDRVVCSLGRGPVVSFADKGTLYDRGLFALAFDTARKNGIPVQTKEGVFGGNEARAVSRAGRGTRVCAVSIPCRYLHSASVTASIRDLEETGRLLRALLLVLAAP